MTDRRLILQRCKVCGKPSFTPTGECAACRNWAARLLAGGSFTIIRASVPAGHVLRDNGIGCWTAAADRADAWE